MHVTFDLSDIEETMQLETELETTLHSFGDVCCLYTAVLVSPVQSIVQSSPQSSPVHSPVQSPAFTESRLIPPQYINAVHVTA